CSSQESFERRTSERFYTSGRFAVGLTAVWIVHVLALLLASRAHSQGVTPLSQGASPSLETTFTRITAGLIATDGGDSSGCAWGDFDNDGFPDLFVGNGGSRNFLYRNSGDGTFVKLTNAVPVRDSGFGGSWGDFDNDGWLDLFVAKQSVNYLYRNNG